MRRVATLTFVSLSLMTAASCALDFGSFEFSNSISSGGTNNTGGAGTGGTCEPFCDGGGGTNPGGMGGTGGTGTGATGGMGGTGGMGTGGGVVCNNPNTCPGMDSDCEFRTCEMNLCGTDVAPKETTCNDDGGNVCDGMGNCIPCDNPPTAPGGNMCPAVCTGGCTGNNNEVCVIECNDPNECAAMTLACPADYDCQVECTGANGCAGATVACPATYQCDVNCNGSNACTTINVNCSTDGPCNLSCGNMQCTGGTLTCGNDACAATCQGGAGFPTVVCGNACTCTDNC
jgi:hypothetical protein